MAEFQTKTKVASPIDGLEKVLQELLSLYREYHSHLLTDTTHMTKLQIEALEKSNKTKTTVLLKIQAVDQARETYVQQIAAHFKLAEKPKLVEILKLVPTDAAKRLSALQEDLHKTINEIKTTQDSTRALASSSLTWINGAMSSLKRMLTPNTTYNPQGQVAHPKMFAGRTVEKRA